MKILNIDESVFTMLLREYKYLKIEIYNWNSYIKSGNCI